VEFERARSTPGAKEREDNHEKFEHERFLSMASARLTSVPLGIRILLALAISWIMPVSSSSAENAHRLIQDSFKSDRAGQSCRICRFHALSHMPGWRNWQTHRT
jgi:hypothetical protein